MNSDGTIDINLNSYVGPNWDGQTINDADKNFGRGVDKPDWSDTLKYTGGLTNFDHAVGVVGGGNEDCADFNAACINVTLEAAEFCSQGKYVATIKGGCRGVHLRGEIVHGGSEVDVDIGNWSDQSKAKTTGTSLALWKPDGKPVTIRVLNGEKPYLTPETGPYRYIFPHPDAWYHGIAVWFFMRFRRVFWK